MNRTQVIRQYLESHPDAMPKTAAEDLQKQGFDIKPQAVSLVKHQMKKAAATAPGSDSPGTTAAPSVRPAKRRGRKKKSVLSSPAAPRTAAANAGEISFDALRKAKELATQIGGVAKARAALDALAQLTG